MGQMSMTDVGMTQDNFILPAPLVGGLPISHDWLDRMKLVHDHTIPIILPSGKNILADAMCLQSLSGTPTLTQGNSSASRLVIKTGCTGYFKTEHERTCVVMYPVRHVFVLFGHP